MIGEKWTRRDRHGNVAYRYVNYVCGTYAKFGADTVTHVPPPSRGGPRVLGWLVYKLQEVYLGPGRDVLVHNIRRQLQGEKKANSGDVERLQKRAADLDREVGRLVKAIRTIDATELTEELAIVRGERDKGEGRTRPGSRVGGALDVDAEAEAIANSLWSVAEQLTAPDPAVLREVLRRLSRGSTADGSAFRTAAGRVTNWSKAR